jgi:predicted transcriptional regulator
MTITITDASAFTVACRKHGLTRKTAGLTALQDLIQLREAPSPARPLDHNARTKFSTLRYIGPLIANGLAAFDRAEQHYHITEAGLDWLERLQSVGIISPH